jgi:putative selenate reductase
MKTTGLPELLERIAGEYSAKASIFEIPEKAFRSAFELEAESPGLEVMGKRISLPVGPAAGPHTQIAPNLVAAYLAGARAFELKTVQENDSLEIGKPCIDALDEGHNTEWSTELSLEGAREEYLRGWIAIQLLDAIFSEKPGSFLFNMSVGYTLAGIKGGKVDAFIEGMREPAEAPRSAAFWKRALGDLEAFVGSASFAAAFGGEARAKARSLLGSFPSAPVHSVTLSTMHGCPPAEIERIGAYLIEVKGFDAFVKLNPTLLGYDEARRILDATAWERIEIRRDNFEHDLQFADALKLIASLDAKARASGRRFGVKLSNTLANANRPGPQHGNATFLPGDERYMSGRALFPLTIALAAELSGELASAVPRWDGRFSYCGGAWAKNSGELVAAGLGPITIATDILKPGGYLRLLPAARSAVRAIGASPDRPDPKALAALAAEALERPEYRGDWKEGKASIRKPLPLFDCFAAPCIEACPVNQKVPEYIRLGAEGRAAEAFGTVIADNPLPFVTGTLCDHVCQDACCRNDYEGAVEIRACKLAVARSGGESARVKDRVKSHNASIGAADIKVAIIGAGPAGLACAHHLALAGIRTTVFDRSPSPGGVPANVIPKFRMLKAELEADIERIASLGVEMRFGTDIKSLDSLRAEGFAAFFIATGAPVARELKLEGRAIPVVDALAFLAEGGESASWGTIRRVVVAGGGNTAMDAVRLALRMPGVEEVGLSYRRRRSEMPADKEELERALEEGGKLIEMSLPERAIDGPDGPRLELRLMEMGELDASGRRAPKPTDKTATVPCDLLVAAVGENPDSSLLSSFGVELAEGGRPLFDPATQESRRKGVYVGGDAARGPASIISAEADGRRAAYAILRVAGIEPPATTYAPPEPNAEKLASRGEILDSLSPEGAGFLEREAQRCLSCDSACLRCVEVCPNRANVALPIREAGAFAQGIQILHVDALCNECGNCGLFCPYEGEPYRGKVSLFGSRPEMDASRNAGFAIVACGDDGGAEGRAFRDHSNVYGGSGSEPKLLFREESGGGTRELTWAEWSAPGSGGRVAALARSTWFEHRYLLGGER